MLNCNAELLTTWADAINEQLSRIRRDADQNLEGMASIAPLLDAVERAHGLTVSDVHIGPYAAAVSYYDVPSCLDFMPVLEALEDDGWECYATADYPGIHNRDYQLTKAGLGTLRLSAYFTSSKCRKVAVSQETVYRLECGVDE